MRQRVKIPTRWSGARLGFSMSGVGSVSAEQAVWNLPATLSVQQGGNIPLRQYALNSDGWQILVSNLPAGVTYNSGLERLEGAATGTSSGTATFTLTRVGGSDVVATATVSLISQEYPAGYYPSVYPLELVSPRAAGTAPSADSGTPSIPSGHRVFKAYPGIEYNIRAVVIGGAYPYLFSLSNAPAGMTINARTGEISWPNPQANATPTITVTDMDGNTQSASWTINVSPSGWAWIDPNASAGGDGSMSSPYRSLYDMDNYNNGSSLNSWLTDETPVIFRGGTYNLDNLGRENSGQVSARVVIGTGFPKVWIAYPGEQPVIDGNYPVDDGAGFQFRAQRYYIDGIDFTRFRLKAINDNVGAHYSVIRRCHIYEHNPSDEDNGGSNPGMIMLERQPPRYYWTVQDCEFSDCVIDGAMKLYGLRKCIIEDNYAPSSLRGFLDPKEAIDRWTIRANELHCNYGIGGNQNEEGGVSCSGEICYNLVDCPIEALLLNQFGAANYGRVDSYRNTYVGPIDVRNISSDDGPVNFDSDVIVNSSAGITTTNLSDGSRITEANLLEGTASSGFIDANGLLVGSSRSSYLNLRGHEIEGA